MKCPKCGNTNIREGQKFCTKCGQNLKVAHKDVTTIQQTASHQEKGLFTEAVRSVANAVTGGALNRDIQREQAQAVRRQLREDEQLVENAQNAQQTAERAQQRAEQDAEQRRDLRNLDAISGMDVIQGKAIWNIQPGEIARRVSEREFLEVENLKGVIIQEGCRAIVIVDGQMIGMLSGGAYTFPSKSEEEKKAEKEKAEKEVDKERTEKKPKFEDLGVFGEIGLGLRTVHRFFFGKRKGEEEAKAKARKERVEQKLKKLQRPRILSVFLVSDRILTLTFGGMPNSNGGIDFIPMTIPTRIHDIKVGVSLQMQISNIGEFANNYLNDRKNASLTQFQQILQPTVENVLKQYLRNLEYDRDGLPEPVVKNVCNRIQTAINDRLYGIECTKVLEITDSNAEFDRFRSVERELYTSEKELEYLQRTGEFRNRLVSEKNNQALQQSRSEEELRYALALVNKDQLLHEAEIEQFVLLLEGQKRLREAKSKEEEYEALQDLRKSRLAKDEELAVLEAALEQHKIDRDSITDMMRLQSQHRIDEARIKNEFALADAETLHAHQEELRKLQHTQQVTELELDNKRRLDQYSDERRQATDDYEFAKQQRQSDAEWQQRQREEAFRLQQEEIEYNRAREEKQVELEILERKARIAQENMRAMKEQELAALNAQNAHLQQMHAMDQETEHLRIQTEANMTQEQIAAAHMKDIANLDASAQAEMAKMMGSGREKEAEMLREQQQREREMYDRMMQMQMHNQQEQQKQANASNEQMMQMMQMMMSGMTQMGQNNMSQQQAMQAQQQQFQQQRIDDISRLKDEYRENMVRQQERTDANQEQALNYTTRVTQTDAESAAISSLAGSHQGPGKQEMMTFCSECGSKVPFADGTCSQCGAPLE